MHIFGWFEVWMEIQNIKYAFYENQMCILEDLENKCGISTQLLIVLKMHYFPKLKWKDTTVNFCV